MKVQRLLVVACVCGLSLTGFWVWRDSSEKTRAFHIRSIVNTRNILQTVLVAIEQFALLNGRLPGIDGTHEGNIATRDVFRELSGAGSEATLPSYRIREWRAQSTIPDSWEKEIHISAALPRPANGTVQVSLWSDGPNGKDENGAGDDVTLRETIRLTRAAQ